MEKCQIDYERKSKLIGRWLHPRPDTVGTSLDKRGRADVTNLLEKAACAEIAISQDELINIVKENDWLFRRVANIQGRTCVLLAKCVAFALTAFCCLTRKAKCIT